MGKRKAETEPASAKKSSRIQTITETKTAAAEKDKLWRKVADDMLVYRPEDSPNTSKIAAFDVDSTIITTKSGKVFPTSPKDWKILYKEIPEKLQELHKDGFKIVFLTNQLGISKGHMSEAEFKGKAESIVAEVGCPVHVQAAMTTGWHRKPAPGTWRHLVNNENGGVAADMTHSFFCGDAAGRPEDKAKKIKKDFSCADRLFALNCGLKFYTPEELFLNQTGRPYNLPEFNAKNFYEEAKKNPVDNGQYVGKKQEMIVNVGLAASGKSHFSKKVLVSAGYEYVSRDKLGTWQKCVARAKEALAAGKSVVVDNTNPDAETRARYVDVAKEHGVPARCFHFPADIALAKHNEAFRRLTDPSHDSVPEMVLRMFNKKFEQPTVDEGFTEVLTVPFKPSFSNKKDEELWCLHLLEK